MAGVQWVVKIIGRNMRPTYGDYRGGVFVEYQAKQEVIRP
jgi:hypothetical protein